MWSPKRLAFSLTVVFTLAVVWVQTAAIVGSGVFDRAGNLIFYNWVLFHDSLVHLALAGQIEHHFPPLNFAQASCGPVKNYHYLFDGLLALAASRTPFSLLDLYYRIIPVLLSLALCLAAAATVYTLTKKPLASALAVLLALGTPGLAQVLSLLAGVFSLGRITPADNIFMFDSLTGMMVNPQGVLSLILYLALFLCLTRYEADKKPIWLVVYSLVLGLSFGVKAYGGVVFALGAVSVAVYFLLRRDFLPVLATLFGGMIMGAWFLITVDSRAAGLRLAPFWLLDRMIGDADRLNLPKLLAAKESLMASGGWIKWTIVSLGQVVIYLFGGLGLKVLGIIPLVKRRLPNRAGVWFLSASALAAAVIPVIFDQGKKAYDIVQFLPYFSLYMGILLTLAVFWFWENLPGPAVKTVFLLGVVGLVLGLNQSEIRTKLAPSPEKIILSAETMKVINYFRTQTSPDAVVLLTPTPKNLDYAWFSALAARRTVLSDTRFAFQVGCNNGQEARVKDYFAGRDVPVDYDYAVIAKDELPIFDRIEGKHKLTRVFESKDTLVLAKPKI